MQKTSIEWVRNPDGSQGYTFNPITGCLNGCPYCYARKLAMGRLFSRYITNRNVAPETPPDTYGAHNEFRYHDPFYPRFWVEKLYHPWGGKPKGIFVCDMSDLFGIGIPAEWTETVLNLCRLHSENRYYLLTKQPQNLAKFSPYPPNVYLGVSVTGQEMFDKAIYCLKMVDAKVKFLSFEPLLDHIIVDKA